MCTSFDPRTHKKPWCWWKGRLMGPVQPPSSPPSSHTGPGTIGSTLPRPTWPCSWGHTPHPGAFPWLWKSQLAPSTAPSYPWHCLEVPPQPHPRHKGYLLPPRSPQCGGLLGSPAGQAADPILGHLPSHLCQGTYRPLLRNLAWGHPLESGLPPAT